MTERANYSFVVKAYPDGTPWIVLEPYDSQLSVFANGFLGFDLRKGISGTEAEALAAELNRQITTTGFTDGNDED